MSKRQLYHQNYMGRKGIWTATFAIDYRKILKIQQLTVAVIEETLSLCSTSQLWWKDARGMTYLSRAQTCTVCNAHQKTILHQSHFATEHQR